MQTADLDILDETDADDEWTTCDMCHESVRIVDTDDDCYCPGCHQIALEEAAAEAKEEAVAEAQDELDEAESDLEGLLEELRDVQERLAECRRAIKNAKSKVAKLSQ